jgi:threonine synthase
VYDLEQVRREITPRTWEDRRGGMWKYRELLPVAPETTPVSLAEGGTPLVRLPELEQRWGLRHLYVKDESRNPTGSFKDRLCSVAVTLAAQVGAEVVTVASTGNHGSSTAAYAGKAGLDCVIFTLAGVPLTMKVLMQVYGARLVAMEDSISRWTLMRQCVEELGWFPTGNYVDPPVGSNCFGVEGYKTIAFEVVEQLGWRVPDLVFMPTAFADGLWGTWKGFVELAHLGFTDRLPRMVACEVIGPLARALEQGLECPPALEPRSTVAFSIGNHVSSYQGLRALRDSGGMAVVVSDDEILDMQQVLGRLGMYVEASSATSLAAVRKLRAKGTLTGEELIVAVVTATGQRDPQATASRLPPVPVVGCSLEQLLGTLKDVYGYNPNKTVHGSA